MKIKVVILLLLTMIFFVLSNTFAQTVTSSIPTSQIDKLDEVADEALQMTKIGRYEEAKQVLQAFSNEITEASLQKHIFSFDEMRILTLAHNQALDAITNANMGIEEKINQVTTFRLVIDALNSKYQPLWTQMQDPIMLAISQLKAAAEDKDNTAYSKTLDHFLAKYNIIQPSLKVDIPVAKLQELDAEITSIDKYRSKILSNGATDDQLNRLETDLRAVFEQMSEDESDPSIWWVIISTGSIIILTLSYVGWRKYRGQKQEKLPNHND